jgi:hypothetical protein
MSNQKAFPITNSVDYNNGMDLRDYFAAKVLQAILTTDLIPHDDLLVYSKAAYEMADAMMEARQQ